ncbi:MAG: replication-relaxation family protein [Planctomycetes bacterium]|nr:replication-relaxation family protein [Planctomycetota bacterium]
MTDRDLEVFAALDQSPLTAAQLLTLSRTFERPFTDERRVRERLHLLTAAGRVHRAPYATAGQGAPNYYRLSRLGHQLLHGSDAEASRRHFGAVGLSHQHHTRSLADVIVHTMVTAHASGIRVAGFYPENALHLQIGDESLYPDCAFQLLPSDGRQFSFFVELDNSSERVRSAKSFDSWERKLKLYEALQDQSPTRFRVLVVTTRQSERLRHILDAAGSLLRNPQRSLIYGIHLQDFLAQPQALTAPCFTDHRRQPAALVPIPCRRPMPDAAAKHWLRSRSAATMSPAVFSTIPG